MSPNKMIGVQLRRLRLRRIIFAVVVTFSMIAAIDVIEVVHWNQNTSIMEMWLFHSATNISAVSGESKARLIKILARGGTNEAKASSGLIRRCSTATIDNDSMALMLCPCVLSAPTLIGYFYAYKAI